MDDDLSSGDVQARFVERGRAEGAAAGEREGEREGRDVGRAKGVEIGSELGYYRGVCAVFLGQERPERSRKALDAVVRRIDAWRDLHDLDVDAVRALFRAALAHCNASHLAFRKSHSGEDESLSF